MLFGSPGHVGSSHLACIGGRKRVLVAKYLKGSCSTDYFSSHHRPKCDCVAAILPFHTAATFQFLRKMDLAFSSLLKGVNVETGEPLPGFQGAEASSARLKRSG